MVVSQQLPAQYRSLLELHDRLEIDLWRADNGFSESSFGEAQEAILSATSPAIAAEVLGKWLNSHQPCIFGRYAAAGSQISICIIREEDLIAGDAHVAGLIEDYRRAWHEEALQGRRHSFVLLLATEKICSARPTRSLLDLSRALLRLYRGDDSIDSVVFDEIFFEQEIESNPIYWRWKNGINVFAPQGDNRWWHDHRIPGGIAFTMNAIGHMAFCHVFKPREMSGENATIRNRLINWALPVAMLTINTASRNKFGRRGSWLVEAEDGIGEPPFCRDSKPGNTVSSFDWRKYSGAFQTDHTIQSSFFVDSVERPTELVDFNDLDFSYLHDISEEDYKRIGTGEQADPLANEILQALMVHVRDER